MIDWEKIARAETHPLRVELLETIIHRPEPVSPSWLAEELGEPLGNVSYHVKELVGANLIRLDHTEPRRGAVEHFYVPAGGAMR